MLARDSSASNTEGCRPTERNVRSSQSDDSTRTRIPRRTKKVCCSCYAAGKQDIKDYRGVIVLLLLGGLAFLVLPLPSYEQFGGLFLAVMAAATTFVCGRVELCRNCASRDLVPVDSPRGQEIINKSHAAPPD